MPELPEVETIVRRLQEVLPGKVIASIEVLREKSFQGDGGSVAGVSILQVTRRAKIITIALSNRLYLLIHLKMTGQLIYVDGSKRLGGGHPTVEFVSSLPAKHTRVVIHFSDKTTLFFNDQRVFGWVKVLTGEERDNELRVFAPDVIDPIITADHLFMRFQRAIIPIKVAVMDREIMSGVGNIYACDGLFEARINPARPANSLTMAETTRVLAGLRLVIHDGIRLGGASIQHFTHIDGLSGSYQDAVRVYGKTGKPCPRCKRPIVRKKIRERSTFFCEQCQL